MRNFRIVLPLAALAALASCGKTARINGTLAEAPDAEVIVRLLDVNRYETLDTVRTDAGGRYSYKMEMQDGQPEFVYLFHGDTKIASLLLQAGDKVEVKSDTLGTYSVTGSDETLKLMEVDKDEAEFNDRLSSMAARLADLDETSEDAGYLRKDMTSLYIDYYRDRVKYILKNSHSLTAVPVLYQTLPNGTPVFNQPTDAIHFRNICDSLKKTYPGSRYVKALNDEAARRQQIMSLNARIRNAEQMGFPEISMSDVNGQKVKLSDMKSKVVMLYFWNPEDAAQKMFNQDEMKPAYRSFHEKGFDIYSVAATSDKALWASVVKSQELPWTNVCDVSGSALSLYNVKSLPTVFFIVDGSIEDTPGVKDGASIRKFLSSKL